jgi:hypothetical protein
MLLFLTALPTLLPSLNALLLLLFLTALLTLLLPMNAYDCCPFLRPSLLCCSLLRPLLTLLLPLNALLLLSFPTALPTLLFSLTTLLTLLLSLNALLYCCPFLRPSLLAALSYGPPYSAASLNALLLLSFLTALPTLLPRTPSAHPFSPESFKSSPLNIEPILMRIQYNECQK